MRRHELCDISFWLPEVILADTRVKKMTPLERKIRSIVASSPYARGRRTGRPTERIAPVEDKSDQSRVVVRHVITSDVNALQTIRTEAVDLRTVRCSPETPVDDDVPSVVEILNTSTSFDPHEKRIFKQLDWGEPDEKIIGAVVVLQRFWRRCCWRRHDRVVRLQQYVRAYLARRHVGPMRRERRKAARCLQRFARGPVTRRRFSLRFRSRRRRQCAITIQRALRGSWGRQTASVRRVRRRHEMATIIKSRWRRFRRQRSYDMTRRRTGATRVQSTWRGYHCRDVLQKDRAFKNRMAQIIKKLFRGERGRRWAKLRYYEVRCKAALRLQRHGRGHLARSDARRRRWASKVMVMRTRAYLARKHFECRRMCKENEVASQIGDEEWTRAAEWIQTKDARSAIKDAKIRIRNERRSFHQQLLLTSETDKQLYAMRTAFKHVDREGHGWIDRDGFAQLLSVMYTRRITPDNVATEWASLKRRRDDVVQFGEFCRWCIEYEKAQRRLRPDEWIAHIPRLIWRVLGSLFGSETSRFAKRRVVVMRKVKVMKREREQYRKHHLRPPYTCKNCMRTFLSKWHLKRHMKQRGAIYCDEESIANTDLSMPGWDWDGLDDTDNETEGSLISPL